MTGSSAAAQFNENRITRTGQAKNLSIMILVGYWTKGIEMIMRIAPFIFLATFSLEVQAKIIEDQRGKVDVTLPGGWSYEQNILGLPHVFLTDEKPERTSLSMTLTGLAEVKLSEKDLKKTQIQYQQGRREYVEKRQGKVERFLPYELLSHRPRTHFIGIEYSLNKTSYREESYFVECPKSLVHLKLLGLKTSAKVPQAREIVRSLKCLP